MSLSSRITIRIDEDLERGIEEVAARQARKPADVARIWLRAGVLQDQLDTKANQPPHKRS